MKINRNFLILAGFALFALWYGGTWAYQTQYKSPRDKLQGELEVLEKNTEQVRKNVEMMEGVVQANQGYYTRSFPQTPNSARMLYQNWLLDLAKYAAIQDVRIDSLNPSKTAYGFVYQFQLNGRLNSEGLTRLLYEFYWAPFLHRVVSFQLNPIEKSEEMRIDAVIEGIALYPASRDAYYPLVDKLPQGTYHRLASGPFSTYAPLAERSLLQYAKPGLDRSDYTYLTAVNYVDEQPVIWLTDRMSNELAPIEVRVGERIQIGSFAGTLVETVDENVVFEREGQRWLLTNGECLNKAFAIPPEIR